MATIWAVVGIIAPLLLGAGLSLLGFTPPDFKNARRLTWAAFGVLSFWTVAWIFLTSADTRTQIYTLIGIGATNIIMLPIAMLFIGHRERIYELPSPPVVETEPQHDDVRAAIPAVPAKIPVRFKVSLKFTKRDEGPDRISLVLRNTGGSDALHIHIKDIHVHQRTIRFTDTINVLNAGNATSGLIPIVVEYPVSSAHDIGQAFYEAACAGNQGTPRSAAFDYQGEARFYDADATEYKAMWLFRFFPLIYRRVVVIQDSDMLDDDDDEESGPYLIVTDVGIYRADE